MKKRLIIIIVTFGLVLQGCATKGESNMETANNATGQEVVETTEDSSENVDAEVTVTSAAEISEREEVSVTPVETNLILPVTVNDTGKVLIQTVSASSTYLYNSYIITSANGESVVVDPTQMPVKSIVDINPGSIMSTHSHPDHTDSSFSKTYDVPKIFCEKGDIQTNDFHIYSILSSHSNDTIQESNKNVIIVIEVDGLRIAHMGDLGQTTLTEEQLTELGEIDIAFTQFENSYSNMSLENEKGFTLIEQLNPKIIIPTHYTENALPIFEEKYGETTEYDNILEISKEDLPDTKLNVYRILNNHKYY